MLTAAHQRLQQEQRWIQERRERIDTATQSLERDFSRLLAQP
jgi:hypothetical protein